MVKQSFGVVLQLKQAVDWIVGQEIGMERLPAQGMELELAQVVLKVARMRVIAAAQLCLQELPGMALWEVAQQGRVLQGWSPQ